LIDNEEVNYGKTNWESLHGNIFYRVGYLGDRSAAAGADELVNYGYMDFDPTWNDQFVVDTKGKSSVKIRYVAGDVQPIRVLPVELVAVTG